MWKMFLALVMALAVEGCASTRPVLYPNEQFNAVGAEAAERDIASCMALAEAAGADAAGRDAGQAVARTATGAAVGAASGAVGGAVGARRAPDQQSARPVARPPDSCTGYSARRNAVRPL
jgi:hypothetical protein